MASNIYHCSFESLIFFCKGKHLSPFPSSDWYFIILSNIFPPFLSVIDISLCRQVSSLLCFQWLIFHYEVKHLPSFPFNDWYSVVTSNIFPPILWMIDILLWRQTYTLRSFKWFDVFMTSYIYPPFLCSFKWLIFCYDVIHLPSVPLNTWHFVMMWNIHTLFLWMIDFLLWRRTSTLLEWLIFCHDVIYLPSFSLNDWYFVMTSNIHHPLKRYIRTAHYGIFLLFSIL